LVVPTIDFRLLYGLIVLAVHGRRRLVHMPSRPIPLTNGPDRRGRTDTMERLIGSIRRECLDHMIVLTWSITEVLLFWIATDC
jgi:hypothetical protein